MPRARPLALAIDSTGGELYGSIGLLEPATASCVLGNTVGCTSRPAAPGSPSRCCRWPAQRSDNDSCSRPEPARSAGSRTPAMTLNRERKADISTSEKTGHLYFGRTWRKHGAFSQSSRALRPRPSRLQPALQRRCRIRGTLRPGTSHRQSGGESGRCPAAAGTAEVIVPLRRLAALVGTADGEDQREYDCHAQKGEWKVRREVVLPTNVRRNDGDHRDHQRLEVGNASEAPKSAHVTCL